MSYIAKKGFNDPGAENGYQKRGKPWSGNELRAKELQLLGLIAPARAEGKVAVTPSNKMAPAPGNKGSSASKNAGAELVRQKAEKAVAAVATVTDLSTLEAARAAEHAKGEKARATVLEAIEVAIKAATSPEA